MPLESQTGAAPVTVVSGPPRAGTSLMMQMLEAGGVAPLCDDARPPDAGNPRGYYELQAVKRLPAETGWLSAARGRAVKVVHALASSLPRGERYRVLWMERAPLAVARSQRALLERLGRAPSDDLPDERVAEILSAQLARVAAELDARPDVERWTVRHAALLGGEASARGEVERVAAFLGGPLDVAAMVACVDPALHRVLVEVDG